MADSKSLEYIHKETSEDTVGKFFRKNQPLTNNLSLIDFLKYKGDSTTTNASRLLDKYDGIQEILFGDYINEINKGKKYLLTNSEAERLPLNINTTLLIPKGNFIEEIVSIQGKNLFLEQKNFTFFFADKLYALLTDLKYVKAENLKLEGRDIDIEYINENAEVWIWVRALNKIVNVSPFIQDMSTQKSDIGSFSITLNPIHNLEDLQFIESNDILSYYSLNDGSRHEIDFFHKNIQYNDIVFIRFEKLELEKELRESFQNQFIVDKSSLAGGKIWDMIGLVDICSISNSFSNTDYSVSVTGRDFMKLLVEDGSYFLTQRFLSGGIISFKASENDKWFKRMFADPTGKGGFLNYNFNTSQRSIIDTVGFIVNQLSNLGVLGGEELFSNYEDRRTSQYQVTGAEYDGSRIDTKLIDGVWQIIKIMYDSRLSDRRVVDPSVTYIDSTILDQFNKICQKPFVEFFGDTYGDEFNLIVRQPPFDKESIQSFLKGIRVDVSDQKSINKSTSQDFNFSLWNKKGKDGLYQIIEVEAKDLDGYSNLQWDDTYYSWYELQPNDQMLGDNTTMMTGGLIPILYLERIAETYGNHRLVIPDNYLFIGNVSSDGKTKDNNSYRRSLLNDLKYVVDSNIYLPFTRKGTLNLVKGDRRIKKGIFIRVKPTNEIFYVDSVSNSISFSNNKVNRSTTIQVSRGMLEEYIWGQVGYDENGKVLGNQGNPTRFSYFDIANTNIISKKIIQKTNEVKQEESKSTVKQNYKYNVAFGSQFTLAYRNNNPGNLKYAKQTGAILGENGFAKFANSSEGFEALMRQVNLDKKRGDTIYTFIVGVNGIGGYAPASENNSLKYVSDLSNGLGVNQNTKLSEIDTFKIAEQIIKLESSSTVTKVESDKELKEPANVNNSTVSNIVEEDQYDFSLNDEQFDFFLKRQQFNYQKFSKR